MRNGKIKFTTTLNRETIVELERIKKDMELKHLNDVIEKLVEEKKEIKEQ